MVPNMIRTLALPIALFAAAAPAAATDRRYPVDDFDRVVIEGAYSVHLVVGGATSAIASGTNDALDRVSIDVQGQTLRIRRNRNAWVGAAGADPGPVTVELVTRAFRSGRLIGPASLEVAGARGLNVEFMVEGSGRIRATHVAADTLSLGLLGSGALEIAGTADILRGEFQGTGDIEASHLVAHTATITTNTAGTISVTVNGAVAVTANGLGDIAILGHPNCTLSGPGVGQVRCAGSDQR